MLPNSFERRPARVRLTILAAAEIVVGLLLYAVFTYTPTVVEWTFGFAALIFNRIHSSERNRSRSLGALLCAITAVVVLIVDVALRITNYDVWVRPLLVGLCLMATLEFFDRRADGE